MDACDFYGFLYIGPDEIVVATTFAADDFYYRLFAAFLFLASNQLDDRR
jgi:hypothetical protein